MVSINDKNPSLVISRLAAKLGKTIEYPEWATFVKTGVSKERPPAQEDWWFIRAGSILRKIYINGPIGVSKLATIYGGKRNLGHQPSHFRKGSRKIIRTIVQQLEEKGYVSKDKKGRSITSEGKKFIANSLRGASNDQ